MQRCSGRLMNTGSRSEWGTFVSKNMTGGRASESESTDTDPQLVDHDPSCHSSPADINWSSGGSSSSCDNCAAAGSGGPGSSSKPHKANNDAGWEAMRRIRAEGPLGLSNFRIIHKLGSGDIGSVYLAELKGTDCYFAIKAMDKKALSGRNKMIRAETEREILETLDHPFLPTLYAHLDEAQLSCLVMEFCPGGDLHVLRQRQSGKRFRDNAARFYASEVLLALEYLHMLGIVYRDLKPENVLVREDGHIMLTDFDLSLKCTVHPMLLQKPTRSESLSDADADADSDERATPPAAMPTPSSIIQSYVLPCTSRVQPSRHHQATTVSCLPVFHHFARRKSKPPKFHSLRYAESSTTAASTLQLFAEPTDARSMSFVGTHEYLAPEIIAGEGHGNAVDWWTLGIFIYELLYGRTPFRGPDNDKTLANVVAQALHFPDEDEDDEGAVLGPGPSAAAKDLIRGLLVKDPAKRMASARGAAEIKQHAFFRGINWALIRCSIPPHIPSPFVPPRPRRPNTPDKRPTNGDFEDF